MAAVDRASWSPFGRTVTTGVLDVDLLVIRRTDPLAYAVDRLRHDLARNPGA